MKVTSFQINSCVQFCRDSTLLHTRSGLCIRNPNGAPKADPVPSRGIAVSKWAKTAGEHLVRASPGALDHRRFWDAMNAISPEDLVEIERRIVARMVDEYEVDL